MMINPDSLKVGDKFYCRHGTDLETVEVIEIKGKKKRYYKTKSDKAAFAGFTSQRQIKEFYTDNKKLVLEDIKEVIETKLNTLTSKLEDVNNQLKELSDAGIK